MQHDRRECRFEIKKKKIAHEIIARRQRREAAGDDLIEGALFEKRIELGRAPPGVDCPPAEFPIGPLVAVDRQYASVEIGRLQAEAKRGAIGLELPRKLVLSEIHQK